MKTYKFKLYQHKRNRHLHRTLNAAGNIYNHCIALHKRYYRLFGKHLNKNKLMKHIAKLRNKNEYWRASKACQSSPKAFLKDTPSDIAAWTTNYAEWRCVGSQAAQDIVQRIDRAYQLFFKHHKKGVRPPNFRKRIKYKSFTLKQAGYKFLDSNQLKIGKRVFKYWKSREIKGKIKTVTIKRNPLGEIFIFVVTDYQDHQVIPMTGNSAGFDFGLKVFLSCSDSTQIKSPLFLKHSLKQLRLASRKHSTKKRGSKNREKARQNLFRVHEKVVNRRCDWFWKLAHHLTATYDYLFFETLNLKGMQRLWGRKIGDLALAEFLKILDFVAEKKGKIVSYIDRWYPSTKTCSKCDFVIDKLGLNERYWVCPSCSTKHGRDNNASRVIHKVGASTLGLGDVSRLSDAIAV